MQGKPPCDLSAVARPQDLKFLVGVNAYSPNLLKIDALINALLKSTYEEKMEELGKFSNTALENLVSAIERNKSLLTIDIERKKHLFQEKEIQEKIENRNQLRFLELFILEYFIHPNKDVTEAEKSL